MSIFGCVAGGFTGAGDAASFLIKGGMSVQLFNGIPVKGNRVGEGIQAIVIALKSRVQDTGEAVADTLRALGWLGKQKVEKFHLKYCSTSDSTPKGNVGPAADMTVEFLGVSYTVLCPTFPVNGRMVVKGESCAGGVPPHENSIKDHPLTPVWDARITNLMKSQSKYSCVGLWREQMDRPADKIHAILSGQADTREYYYVIPDYQDMEDGEWIVELFGNLILLTGGSGILEPLVKHLSRRQDISPELDIWAEGIAVLIVGSCPRAALEQTVHFQTHGGFNYKMDPMVMSEGRESLEDTWRFARKNWGTPVFIYSSDTARNVKEVQRYGQERVAKMLEQAAVELVKQAVAYGIRRVVAAGGETSGVAAKRLGLSSYRIGASVAPGVSIMVPMKNEALRLALKSGSFRQEGSFVKVLEMTQTEDGE